MSNEQTPLSKMTDEELMARVQQNDEMAFELLVERYQHALTTFVSRFVGRGPHVQDILQETFIRVWRHRMRYKTVAKFSTWVFTIAGNLSKTELRRRKIRRGVYIGTGSDSHDEERIDVVDEDADPERDAERSEIRRVVLEEMEKLPVAYKAAVILRDIHDKSYEEIGEILRVPVGTIKSRVNRGRQRLQKVLGVLRDPGQSGWEPD